MISVCSHFVNVIDSIAEPLFYPRDSRFIQPLALKLFFQKLMLYTRDVEIIIVFVDPLCFSIVELSSGGIRVRLELIYAQPVGLY